TLCVGRRIMKMKMTKQIAFAGMASLLLALSLPAFAVNGYPSQDQPNGQMMNRPPQGIEPPVFLMTDKREYDQNERIHMQFKALPSFSSSAWIGMLDAGYPHGDANENDKHDIAYQYLSSRLRGELVFDAPKEPGEYDLRLMDNGREYYAVP